MRTYRNGKPANNPKSLSRGVIKRDSKKYKTVERVHDPEGKFARSVKAKFVDTDGDGFKDSYGKAYRNPVLNKGYYARMFAPYIAPKSGGVVAGGGGGGGGGVFAPPTVSPPIVNPAPGVVPPDPPFASDTSLLFDGTNDVAEATIEATVFDEDFSISFWVKPSRPGSDTILLHLGSDIAYTDGFRIYQQDGGFSFWSGVDGYENVFGKVGSESIDAWQNLIVTRSGSDMVFYIDGASVGTATNSDIFSSTDLSLGYEQHQLFQGYMNEVALFDYGLTEADVSTIHGIGVPTDLKLLNPSNWWRMGDGSEDGGDAIKDASEGGNADIALKGEPTFENEVPEEPEFNEYSLNFNSSNDYISITTSEEIPFYGLSAWVWLDFELTSQGLRGVVFGPSGTNWILGCGGNMTSALTDEIVSVNLGARYGYCSSTETISAGWHHMMVAWSTSSKINSGGPGYDIYIDGESKGNQVSTQFGVVGLHTIGTGAMSIGQRSDGSFNINAKLDEVALFGSESGELSESDVTAIYNNGVPNDISSFKPFGWWRMGDDEGGVGTTITDRGIGNNEGTLIGSPTFSTDVPS